jgi:hypothetical protein
MGYTGILQQMITEVPTKGTDRLAGKLWRDVHRVIPQLFPSEAKTRQRLVSIAEGISAEHGISLDAQQDHMLLEEKRSSFWSNLKLKPSSIGT